MPDLLEALIVDDPGELRDRLAKMDAAQLADDLVRARRYIQELQGRVSALEHHVEHLTSRLRERADQVDALRRGGAG